MIVGSVVTMCDSDPASEDYDVGTVVAVAGDAVTVTWSICGETYVEVATCLVVECDDPAEAEEIRRLLLNAAAVV